MTLGFVGTGAISAAMIEGLCLEPGYGSIVVSPRNAAVASDLAARFPNVRVASDNQQVLDLSDTVVLAVRPQIAPEVLDALDFRPDHKIISLIAAVSLDYLRKASAPASSVTRAVPLPPVARRLGPTSIFPSDPDAIALFEILGSPFVLDEESEFDVFTSATAVMSTYFAFAHTVGRWMARNGVGEDRARGFMGQMLRGLATATSPAGEDDFGTLAQEHQTRGGINEQVFVAMTEEGIILTLDNALDGVLARLRRGRCG